MRFRCSFSTRSTRTSAAKLPTRSARKCGRWRDDHQVLCITHLPQVAAAASTHFVVTKEVAGGRTLLGLHEVSGKARQEEIARMLGGQTNPRCATRRCC